MLFYTCSPHYAIKFRLQTLFNLLLFLYSRNQSAGTDNNRLVQGVCVWSKIKTNRKHKYQQIKVFAEQRKELAAGRMLCLSPRDSQLLCYWEISMKNDEVKNHGTTWSTHSIQTWFMLEQWIEAWLTDRLLPLSFLVWFFNLYCCSSLISIPGSSGSSSSAIFIILKTSDKPTVHSTCPAPDIRRYQIAAGELWAASQPDVSLRTRWKANKRKYPTLCSAGGQEQWSCKWIPSTLHVCWRCK